MTSSTQPADSRPQSSRYALVITLDEVESAFYTGWRGCLPSAKHDRMEMMSLLESAGFGPFPLTNEEATRDSVARELERLARSAQGGDEVVIYFSGHGATLPDLNNDELGVLRDGAWCLSDGFLIDDELTEALTKFNPDVNVVLISDSCFTGTIIRNDALDAQLEGKPSDIGERNSKLAPVDIGERVYEAQREYYDPILERAPVDPDDAKAALLILSACNKGELAFCNDNGSVFTGAIVEVWSSWKGESFAGTYKELFENASRLVRKKSEDMQNPQMRVGGAQRDESLEERAALGGRVFDERRVRANRSGPHDIDLSTDSEGGSFEYVKPS